jgi:hypothetical protein
MLLLFEITLTSLSAITISNTYMEKFKLLVPVKWSLIEPSGNKFKINPLIRALTVHFFNKDPLQIPFHLSSPIAGKNIELRVLSPRRSPKDVTLIRLGDLASEKAKNWIKHGYMKPFTLSLDVPVQFVQDIRDWQWYWRYTVDVGLTPEMAQLENNNEYYIKHRDRHIKPKGSKRKGG